VGKLHPTSRRILPYLQQQSVRQWHCTDWLPFKMKAVQSFDVSATIYTVTCHHTPEDSNPLHHWWQKHNCCNLLYEWFSVHEIWLYSALPCDSIPNGKELSQTINKI
jgi:hypothetical protein